MKIEYFNDPVPFYIIRDYLNEDERRFYLIELSRMKPNLSRTGTGGATDLEGVLKKQNYGLWVEENHVIHKLASKLFGPISWEMREHWFYKIINKLTMYSTLVSYYENGDYYFSHIDDSIITSILYLWEEPKTFKGGELCFGNFLVPIENNSMVIFPSSTEHSVNKVEGYGRWAITNFLHEYLKPNIQIFYNILDVCLYRKVQNFVKNERWEFLGSLWKIDLNNNELFTKHIPGILYKIVNKKMKVENVYACGQLYGQNINIQINRPYFILHTNDIDQDDIGLWGGETSNKHPVPNSGLFLEEKTMYASSSPSKLVSDLKVTIVWIFET